MQTMHSKAMALGVPAYGQPKGYLPHSQRVPVVRYPKPVSAADVCVVADMRLKGERSWRAVAARVFAMSEGAL